MGHTHSTPSVPSLVPANTSIMTLHNDMGSLTLPSLPPLPSETDGATVEGAVTHVEVVDGRGFRNPVEGGGSMITVSPCRGPSGPRPAHARARLPHSSV